ncbi:MAG: ABC transporter ATP-binding protein [Firmicutes bacterium]|uniref:ABC transporter ATP-binding protein n=1 Tax=Candidatus Scybalomonas excrementavium TaxID=2840943 RepID=A0A9D9HYQ5_9FIRM|nr:ABC transporter ATP-binding protein [Candidatus Scybalomonas excrementavium]
MKSLKEHSSTLKKVFEYIGIYKFFVALSLLFAGITVALTLYMPILIGHAVDYLIGEGEVEFSNLFHLFEQMAMLLVVTAVAQWIMNIINNHVTYRVVLDIRTKAFYHLQKVPVSYIDQHPHGDIISRVIADIDQFSDGLLMGFTQLFTGVLTILGTLFFMFRINVHITVVVIVITPVSMFVAAFIAKRTFLMFQAQSEARGELTGFINEMIGNQKVVKAFGYEKEAEKRFDTMNEQLKRTSLQATFFSSITNPSTRFINAFVYACVGVVGAIAVIRGNISVGILTSFLSYANQYTKPFNEISGVVTELQNALACASRVFALIEEEAMPSEEGNESLTEVKGNIELEHVSFSYDPKESLIEDLNLVVRAGEKVAIVGPTGCGKSTMINLLMRFYDVTSGVIRIDGKNMYHLTKESLRKNFGMVLQETWLKTGSIRDNIAYGKEDATEEEIIQAAKLAHAHNFIKKMPQGYDTILTEDGGNLSQGQKQLLCIARVMLCMPPMLILDEATSSIDTRTELLVQKAFEKMMEGRTSFIVAHRLSTIKEADCILVMRHGTIVEKGTHEQLLEKQGFYYQLYHSQFAQ